jgi:hydrogenase maturation protein HypF
MAENRLKPPVLGIAWDGTGLGSDGTIWGGEFLRIGGLEHECGCACLQRHDGEPFQRVAHLRTFRLPGGDHAVKEPRRAAIGLLFEIFGSTLFDREDLRPVRTFTPPERDVLKSMLSHRLNAPVTSSAGRLFDAVSAIVGLRQQARFEGQAAMLLEFAIKGPSDEHYEFNILTPGVPESAIRNPQSAMSRSPESAIRNPQSAMSRSPESAIRNPQSAMSRSPESAIRNPQSAILLDWEPMVHAIIADVARKTPVETIAIRFHNTLCEMIVAMARRFGDERVVLSGGCFQNRYLTERAVMRLEAEGFRVYWHQRVPPNDGGIALGQLAAVRRQAL